MSIPMALVDLRLRTGWLFMAVTVGHIVLISAQVTTKRGVPMLEEVTFGAFAEVQRGTTSAITAVQDAWRDYLAVQDIRRDNERLREEMARLQVDLQQERAEAQQTRSLQDLLDLRSRTQVPTTAASVIAAGASPDFRTVTIDKGTSDGLRADLAVISPVGVVGRLILPSGRASKVQLLIDRNAAAGAIVERSRAQGIVVGTGTDRLRLDYVPSSADVKVGDRVVTSGIEGIYPAAQIEGSYPKGFVIGQIESIGSGASGRTIVVRPAVEFSSLETVLVVLPPGTPEAGTTRGDAPVTAVDEGGDVRGRVER
jgi:rod shape-determining protein MreC